MPDNDAIQQLLAQYDLGDTGGDPHEGSVPRQVAPTQQRPAGIPATKAVPPKDPVTGKFLPAQVQPSATNAQKQVQSEDPLLDGEGQPIQHTRTLLRHALQSGFTDQEIDTTPSEQLQELIFARQREQIAKASHSPQPNVSAVEKKPEPIPEPEVQVDFGEIDKVLDPEVANPLKAHLTAQLKQLKALEAKLEAQTKRQEERDQQQQVVEQTNQLDRMLSKHSALVGARPWQELSKSDPDWIKRHAVLTLADTDKSNRSVQEKIDWAVSQLFGAAPARIGDESAEELPSRTGARPTAEQWANGGVPRPTQRKPAPEINDVKRARQAVQQRLEQLSQPGSNGSVEVDDFPE